MLSYRPRTTARLSSFVHHALEIYSHTIFLKYFVLRDNYYLILPTRVGRQFTGAHSPGASIIGVAGIVQLQSS